MRVQVHLESEQLGDTTNVVIEVWDPDNKPKPLCLWSCDAEHSFSSEVTEGEVIQHALAVLGAAATMVAARLAEHRRHTPIGL